MCFLNQSSMTIKNFWSLNVDEAILVEKLKKILGRNYEVFFPINSTLKDIDLIVYNLKSKKMITIQAKGSRTYIPRHGEAIDEFSDGHTSWNVIKNESIFKPTNDVDFFIFVIHEEKISQRNRKMMQHYIILPVNELRQITKNHKKIRNDKTYHYSFIVSANKKVIEVNNPKSKRIDFSKYLNNFQLLKKSL